MPAMAMTHNLMELKKWAEKSGIPFWSTPQAKNTKPYDGRAQCIRCNTCSICPTGARYSPDFTFKRLLAGKNFALHDRTLVRKLVLRRRQDHRGRGASGESRRARTSPSNIARPVFVLASGYCWSPHLLLLSQCSRFPNGLANRSGLVGRYMCGHAFLSAQIEIDARIYPGMNETARLISRQFFRCKTDAAVHPPRPAHLGKRRRPRAAPARAPMARILLGDACWPTGASAPSAARRACAATTTCIPTATALSRSTIDRTQSAGATRCRRSSTSPMPPSQARQQFTREHFQQLFQTAGAGQQRQDPNTSAGNYLDHPAGGCRMGTDPRPASATATARRTITKTSSSPARPRCPMPAAPTAP